MKKNSLNKKLDIHIGNKLRQRRKKLKLSQAELGEELGITFQQIQKYECGDNRISSSTLYIISKILNVHIDYFFEGFDHNSSLLQIQSFSKEEIQIIQSYNSLRDPKLKELVKTLINTLSQ